MIERPLAERPHAGKVLAAIQLVSRLEHVHYRERGPAVGMACRQTEEKDGHRRARATIKTWLAAAGQLPSPASRSSL